MNGNSLGAMEKAERLAAAQTRSQFFWWMADGLLAGPHAESWVAVRERNADGNSSDADPLAAAWLDMVGVLQGLSAADHDRLSVEHTRLFGGLREGVGPAPPFESAWRAGFEPGALALAVAQAYAAAGFADIDLAAGPQDHLGVELKFMAMLALREAECWQRGDIDAAETRVEQQRAFLDRHLLNWIPGWAGELARRTQEPLFLAYAELLWIGMVRATEDLGVSVDSAEA